MGDVFVRRRSLTLKADLTRVFVELGVDNWVSSAMAVRDAGLLDDV